MHGDMLNLSGVSLGTPAGGLLDQAQGWPDQLALQPAFLVCQMRDVCSEPSDKQPVCFNWRPLGALPQQDGHRATYPKGDPGTPHSRQAVQREGLAAGGAPVDGPSSGSHPLVYNKHCQVLVRVDFWVCPGRF